METKRRRQPPKAAAVSASISASSDNGATRRGRSPKAKVAAPRVQSAITNPDPSSDGPSPKTAQTTNGTTASDSSTGEQSATSNPSAKGRGRPKMPAVKDEVSVTNGTAASPNDGPSTSNGAGRPKRKGRATAPPADTYSESEEEEPRTPKKPVKKAITKKAVTKKPIKKVEYKEEEEEEEEEELSVLTTKQVVMKGRAPVDEKYADAGSVHVFSEGDDVWDVALNQTSIGNNNNKFYFIQLLASDARKNYVVFTRWGRVGVDGQQATSQFGTDLEAAKRQFCAKFKDKTRNEWADRAAFEKVGGKYDMILRDYEATDTLDAAASASASASASSSSALAPVEVPKSSLPQPVQDLMAIIFNIQMMESQVMEMNYDAKKAPLGKLTTAQIRLGYTSLQKIATLLNLGTTVGAGGGHVAATQVASPQALTAASDEYYTRIPHNFGMRRPTVLSTPGAVKREMDLLETLGDIEVAMRALKDSLPLDESPIDHHYKTLHIDIRPVHPQDDTFTLINNYLMHTHGPTHTDYTLQLLDVFSLEKKTEFKDVGNRMLLWHGSRMSNFVGILSQGLRIAPPEAPVTGYMFGKGIYFADVSTKSANYCFSNTSNNVGMMLLCEVALGVPNELFEAKHDADQLPPGKFCTKGVGSYAPDVSTYRIMEDDVKIPVGKCVDVSGKTGKRGALQYNEYIVYDVSQVRMRYLVQVKLFVNDVETDATKTTSLLNERVFLKEKETFLSGSCSILSPVSSAFSAQFVMIRPKN